MRDWRPLELRGHYGGTSPYLDWFLAKYYVHQRAWCQ
jgi:hypothetical protein